MPFKTAKTNNKGEMVPEEDKKSPQEEEQETLSYI
jgi:hypothetical protein